MLILAIDVFVFVGGPRETQIIPEGGQIDVGDQVTCITQASPLPDLYLWYRVDQTVELVGTSQVLTIRQDWSGQTIEFICYFQNTVAGGVEMSDQVNEAFNVT